MSDEIEKTGGEISADSPSWLGYATSWLTENGWDGKDGVERFGHALPLELAERHVSEAKTILEGRSESFIPRGDGTFIWNRPLEPSCNPRDRAVAQIVIARIQAAIRNEEIPQDKYSFLDSAKE